MRVVLPKLNQYRDEIQTWVNQQSGIDFEIAAIEGFWRNTHPSISLQGVDADTGPGSDIQLTVGRVEVEFDLIQSLLQLQPVVAELTLHQMALDVSSINWLEAQAEQGAVAKPQSDDSSVIKQLESIFLRQLDEFALLDSRLTYLGLDGRERELAIDKLRWRNQGKRHLADGIVSVVDSNLNSLSVSAQFTDYGSVADVSGDFYLSADNVQVGPWLTQYIKTETGITKGRASFNSWLTLERSEPKDAYVELRPSKLSWQNDVEHQLTVDSGVFKLFPTDKGWQVIGHSLKLSTDQQSWPDIDLAFNWQPEQWLLNVSQLELARLRPLVSLIPGSSDISTTVDKLQPGGVLSDIRLSMGSEVESLRYSANLTDGSLAQWYLLPEVHRLSAKISGNLEQLNAKAELIDDQLPYGDVFQAPLNIKQGLVDIVWQQWPQGGWSLWADKVAVATPDLQALGAFRLDMPPEQSPLLSFYAEADLVNAGQTWRYLPTLALGRDLTDYLSTAIQGGKVNTAKLLWYGRLADFPYADNNGMFQAWVGLKQGKFSFDTAWPPITDLQLDLLFQNDAMYLDSDHAVLMDVNAERITGRIPHLAPDGHIEIEAKAKGKGNAVRDYMTATPLVDSVGAALTTIQIDGDVDSEFQLNIPFNRQRQPRAWGYADLASDQVKINAPPMALADVSGRVEFDNDVVKAAGLSAILLDQPVSIDFAGENASEGYVVNIDVLGDWDIKPLVPYVGKQWLGKLSGHAPWNMDVDIQLDDVGFTYQIDTRADIKQLVSEFPYPLAKAKGVAGQARLQASGNQETVSARLQVPGAKYQTEIDIRPNTPELYASNLILGRGSFKISPIVGHQAQVRLDKIDLDSWLSAFEAPVKTEKTRLSQLNTPEIPIPERVNLNSETVNLAGLEWHDVAFEAKRKNLGWYMQLNSQEAKGEASYIEPYDLSVSLDRLHVFVPQLEQRDESKSIFEAEDQSAPLISGFERRFHQLMPNLTLNISDFWLQGYKVGKLNMDLQRRGDSLEWKKLSMKSGNNQLDISGRWELSGDRSHTQMNMSASGENNSDVLERFGISTGIQRAPFELAADTEWDGAPWSARISSLQGGMKIKLGKGVVSDVSGAAKLLGLFSLDSIIRKMQLDFSDVFDNGMAFNSLTGTGKLQDGIFITNDIQMDAVAGEMNIKGIANLNSQMVDAEVNFVPDITSGIPVLTAFAVTPPTALYVLAITTVFAPVVEVFTQVNYEVKGPLDSPKVSELSRSRGEFTLPKKMRKEKQQ